MRHAFVLAIVAIILATYAFAAAGPWYALLWPALSFALVAAAYFGLGPRVFGKRPDGRLSAISCIALLPYLVSLWGIWHVARLVSREPATNAVVPRLTIGRRLLSHELPKDVDLVIDLTSEFAEPRGLRNVAHYVSFPILDATSSEPRALADFVKRISELDGHVFIHCAQGHGRTCLVAALYLVVGGHAASADEAIALIRAARPLAKPNSQQARVLQQATDLLCRSRQQPL